MAASAIFVILYGAVYGVAMHSARSKRQARDPDDVNDSAGLLRAEIDAASSWRRRRVLQQQLRVVEDPRYLVRQEQLGFGMALAGFVALVILNAT
jgi:hypothetical protein